MERNFSVVSDGRSVVANFHHNFSVVEIFIYKDGSPDFDQVFYVKFEDLKDVYEDYRASQRNRTSERMKAKSILITKGEGKRHSIELYPKELYNIIIKKREFQK